MGKTELFIYAFVSVCVGAGVITQIAPEGALKKYLKYIVSLCVLAAMLSPLIKAFGVIAREDLSVTFDAEDTNGQKAAEDIVIENGKSRIEDAIRSEISKKWEISYDDVSVEITLDVSNKQAIEIKNIKINVAGVTNTNEIKDYISKLFYGTANVSVSEGNR